MVYTFDDAKAPSRHTTQYFEMLGNRAIYHDGWVAATTPAVAPWDTMLKRRPMPPFIDYKWELYHVDRGLLRGERSRVQGADRSSRSCRNCSGPRRRSTTCCRSTNSRIDRFDVSIRPSLTAGRDEFTYFPGMVRIPEGAAPDLKNKSYQIKAEVVIPKGGAEGMLLTHGGRFAGYGLLPAQGQAGVPL